MTEGVRTIVYPITDLAKAKALYGGLVGVDPYTDEPYYVGFSVGARVSASILTATARG